MTLKEIQPMTFKYIQPMTFKDIQPGYQGTLYFTAENNSPGPIAQPTADSGVVSLIPALSHSFMEIDQEIISTVILLLSLIQEGLMSVTSKSMCKKYWLTSYSSLPWKKCGEVN